MTYAESLDGVKTWYQQVSENLNLNSCVVALVGNKCDMIDLVEVSNKQAKQVQVDI